MSELTYIYTASEDEIRKLGEIQDGYKAKGYNISLSVLLKLAIQPNIENVVTKGIEFLKTNVENIPKKEDWA